MSKLEVATEVIYGEFTDFDYKYHKNVLFDILTWV